MAFDNSLGFTLDLLPDLVDAGIGSLHALGLALACAFDFGSDDSGAELEDKGSSSCESGEISCGLSGGALGKFLSLLSLAGLFNGSHTFSDGTLVNLLDGSHSACLLVEALSDNRGRASDGFEALGSNSLPEGFAVLDEVEGCLDGLALLGGALLEELSDATLDSSSFSGTGLGKAGGFVSVVAQLGSSDSSVPPLCTGLIIFTGLGRKGGFEEALTRFSSYDSFAKLLRLLLGNGAF